MTNFDPGGFLILLTVIPTVIAGATSIGVAHLTARLGYGDYDRNVVLLLVLMVSVWILAALLVTTSMLVILSVVLAMAGAYAATRNVTSASYGWVLGVLLLSVAFALLSAVWVYQGVDQLGRPQGLLSRHVSLFYAVGLVGFGALGGTVVELVGRQLG
ncbi:MAG: hypothetical protein U5K70_05085 [Halodesulfurarchaeum sp.]|nr:hypothetical protein [Halodesulfurarchaeum sp.]